MDLSVPYKFTMWTSLVIALIAYYLYYLIIMVIWRDKFSGVVASNLKLEGLRGVRIKSLQQQKEFIGTKYPRQQPFKFTVKGVWLFILNILLFSAVYTPLFYLARYLHFSISPTNAIAFMVIFPIIANICLRLANLQKSNLLDIVWPKRRS